MLTDRNIFLISGVPGTGKTSIGNFLRDNSGFIHYDIEQLGSIPDFKSLPDNSVLTWGFVPDNEPSLKIISEFVELGGIMIWFDGNRAAARKSFLKRGDVPIEFYNTQMAKIGVAKNTIIERFNAFEINTFDKKGNFRAKKEIISEILDEEN